MDFDFSKQPVIPSTQKSMVNMINHLWLHCISQEEQIAKFKNQANSNNSSMPPSSDSLKIKAERKKQKEDDSRRTIEYWRKPKQGAQPGHKGIGRCLVAIEEVDEIIKLYPDKTCKNVAQHSKVNKSVAANK